MTWGRKRGDYTGPAMNSLPASTLPLQERFQSRWSFPEAPLTGIAASRLKPFLQKACQACPAR